MANSIRRRAIWDGGSSTTRQSKRRLGLRTGMPAPTTAAACPGSTRQTHCHPSRRKTALSLRSSRCRVAWHTCPGLFRTVSTASSFTLLRDTTNSHHGVSFARRAEADKYR